MGKERLEQVPATETSIGQLQDVLNILSLHGRNVHYGLRAEFQTIGMVNVVIDVFDFPPDLSETLSSVFHKFAVRFNEDLGSISKTTVYRLSQDGKSISKDEFFETEEQVFDEQLIEELEEQRQKLKDLEELGWEDFLERHPEVKNEIQVYQAVKEDEEKIGTDFVSEAEIQEVLKRLNHLRPKP